jgi:peptidoglycan/LPS O-acetylase OafA/YrhL
MARIFIERERNMAQARERIPALTGVRSFAAIGIVLYHFWGTYLPGITAPTVIQNSFSAVSFFFVLSGYILAYVYAKNDSSELDRRRFWYARFARIYPLYIFSFLVEFPLIAWIIFHSPAPFKRALIALGSLAGCLGMVQSWIPGMNWRWNTPAWTICCEALFYLLFPWMLLAIRRIKPQRLLLYLVAAYVVTLLPAVFLYHWGIGVTTSSPRTPLFHIVVFNPLFRLFEFFVGMLLGKLDLYLRESQHDSKTWIRPAALYIGFAGTVIYTAFGQSIPFILRYSGAADLIFCALIFGLAKPSSSILCKVMSFSPFILLGEASYAIYIMQFPVGEWFASTFNTFGYSLQAAGTTADAMLFALFLLTLTVWSVLCYKYIEIPAKNWLIARRKS